MAGDKTEKATPKKREDARKEGNVLRSMEVNNAVAMLGGFSLIAFWGPKTWQTLKNEMQYRIENVSSQSMHKLAPSDVMQIFFDTIGVLVMACAPIIVGMVFVGVAASVIQVKPGVLISAIKPRFKKLNPINGIKQKFGPAALVELAKNIIKLVAVGVPAAWLLWSRREELLMLGGTEPVKAGLLAIDLILGIGFRIAGLYIIIAIADYIWQRYRHEKNLRMTKQEVKQEHKNQETSPELRAAIKQRQREGARRRMLSDVPTADVIITNPTHYAIALTYDPDVGAPQVVAKGVDLLALRIREIAEEAGVVRVENRPLARQLYAQVEVGEVIPADLFAAVAEVLAYVYQVNERAQRAGSQRIGSQQIGAQQRLSSPA